MVQLRLPVVFEPVEDDWVQARIPAFPAVITVAPTREEARQMVIDALVEYLAAVADDSTEVGSVDAEELTLTFHHQPA